MTIDFPDFKKSFYYENNFYLSCKPQRIGKFIAHYELYKMIADVTGCIVECGVFKGASFLKWVKFRELLSNNTSQKIIGFDVFGKFPEATVPKEIERREWYLNAAGDQSISVEQLNTILNQHDLNTNIELVEGDILETLPKYTQEHKNLKIALLVVDVDLYEPTRAILEHLYPLVVSGGVVVLDDYITWAGATQAVDEYFGGKVAFKNFSSSPTPTYFIKGRNPGSNSPE